MSKRRKVPPHPGPRFLQRLRQSPDCPSRFLFLRRNRSSPSSLLPTRRSNHRRHRHCHRAAGTAQQSIRQQPLPVPTVRTATIENDAASPIHREADAKCRLKKGSIGRKRPHFFVVSRNFFEQVPVHGPMRMDNTHDQSAPQRLCGRKHRPLSRFLPTDLHLWPFLPIFAPIHVRKTSHPPSSSGLGLDSSPRPAAAIGGENLSLPRQRGANGAHRPQRRRTRRRVSRLPACHRSRHRPRWAARGRKRHALSRPRAPNAPPMPSAPPFAGASARRQARQLQHLPFRARSLHRAHAASILLFRFHRGNTLSFRSTLDRSHGDCSRSAARPTDRLIFSPRFFLFVLVGERPFHRVDAPGGLPSFLHPQPPHAGWGSPPHIKGVHTQVVQPVPSSRQCSSPHFGFSPDASVEHSIRSVAPVQTGTPRSTDSEQALPCGESAPRHGGFIDRHRSLAHDSPHPAARPPQRFSAAAVPLRTARQRHAPAPADSTFPFPVSAAPGAAEPLHPSFSLSFPCPKSFSRGCC